MATTPQKVLPRQAPPARSRADAILPLIVLAVIVAAGAALRFHLIGARQIWQDEAISEAFTRLGGYDLARILWRREGNMALYYLLLRAWTHMGDSVAMLRSLSAVFSVATIVAVYALGKRLFSTAAGLAAALLMAVNAYGVRYAQETRSYSLVSFLACLSTYFLLRAVGGAGEKRLASRWRWYIVFSVLAIYAHFFAVLVVIAHWVTLKLAPDVAAGAQAAEASRSRDAGATQANENGGCAPDLSAAVYTEFKRAAYRIGLWTLPVWLFIATTGAGPIRWIHRPGVRELYQCLQQFAGNGGAPLLALYAATVALALLAALRSRQRHRQWRYLLPLAWFVVPMAIALVFSLARPVFLPRYLIVCQPALVLLAAIGLMSFRQQWMGLPALALLCWLALGGVQAYYQKDFDLGPRPDFRSVAAFILQQAQAGDVVMFHYGQGRFPYAYYAAHATAAVRPTIVFPAPDRPEWRSFMAKLTPAALTAIARHDGRIWVVFTDNTGPAGEDDITRRIRNELATTHQLAEERQLGGTDVCLYTPAPVN